MIAMVTLHIGKLLEDAGFGVLAVTGSEPDADIYWGGMPVDEQGDPKDGIWIVARGIPVTRISVTQQAFDIYSRYSNKLTGSQKLEAILNYLKDAYEEVCELPTVPPHSMTEYNEVRITPSSGIEEVGADEQNKVVRVISGEIRFAVA